MDTNDALETQMISLKRDSFSWPGLESLRYSRTRFANTIRT
jgi:hypothetical protein